MILQISPFINFANSSIPTNKFPIPEEFRSALKYVEPLDLRSDAEILDSLMKHVPVTSKKNIWTYWHAGVSSIPGWCQRNIANWVRLCGPSWTVRILGSVPDSPNNALKWVEADQLPETFVQGTMDGPYVGPHSADFLRGISLFNHGGVWMDVGIVLIRSIDDICWNQLEDSSTPFEVSVPLMHSNVIANYFVASRKGDPFIKRWHDLFTRLWKDRTNYSGIISNPLLEFAKTLDFSESEASNYRWEFKVDPATVFEYIGQVLAWFRLTIIEEPNGFNSTEYWASKVLLFDSLSEDWGAEATIDFKGQDFFDVLVTKLDADRDSEEYQKAYKTIWRLLTKSSLQKITYGKNLTKGDALGVLLDKKENEGKDCAPGTFSELLRYGTVHFAQSREILYIKGKKPEVTMKKGLFEP